MLRSVVAAVLVSALPALAQPAPPVDPEIARALELHAKGDFPGAISAYEAILKRTPGDPLILSNAGAAYARTGNYAQAIAYYKRAVDLLPDNAGIRFNLGVAYSQTGQVGLAIGQLERVTELDPSNRNAALLLADAWLRAGDNKKAIAVLEPRAPQFGDDRAFAYVLGTALIREGQLAKGQPLLDRILRDGDSAEARLLMGTAQVLGRDHKAALEQFERAIQLNPKLPSAYSFYGRTLLMLGEIDRAADAFRRELENNPNDYEANLQLGNLLKQEREFDKSLEHIRRAIELRPASPDARYQLGSALVAAGKPEEARQVLEPLVAERPDLAEAHVSLATAFFRLRRKDDGDRHRTIAEKLNAERNKGLPAAGEAKVAAAPKPEPPNFEELSKRAGQARAADRADEAADLYRQALALKPSWEEGWWYLGTIHFTTQRWAEAAQAMSKLVAVNPEAGAGWAVLGLSQFRLRAYKDAFESLGRAAQKGLPAGNPELQNAVRFHLALLLTRQGDPETGLQYLYVLAREGYNGESMVRAMGVAALRARELPDEVPAPELDLVEAAGRAHLAAASRTASDAAPLFEQLVAKFGSRPGVHYTAGVYLLAGDSDRALEHFRRELELSPKHVQARLQIAFEYIRRADYKAGLPFAREAVQLAPQSFAAHNALGRSLLESGRTQEAVRELETAVRLQPGSAECHFSLARAYERAGMKQQAQQARAEFARLDKLRQEGNR